MRRNSAGAWLLLFFIALVLMVSGFQGSFGRVLGSIFTPSLIEVT